MNGKASRDDQLIYGDTVMESIQPGDRVYVVEVKGDAAWQRVQRSVFASSEQQAIARATDEVLETLHWQTDVLQARILTKEGSSLYVATE